MLAFDAWNANEIIHGFHLLRTRLRLFCVGEALTVERRNPDTGREIVAAIERKLVAKLPRQFSGISSQNGWDSRELRWRCQNDSG
jgi:hypothetical protein